MQRAFRVNARMGQSPIAHFGGQRRTTEQTPLPRQKSSAHQLHATATHASRSSHSPLVDRQALSGSTHQFINSMPPIDQSWLHFKYRPGDAKRDECAATFWRLFCAWLIDAHLTGCRATTRAHVREMVTWRMLQLTGRTPFAANFQPKAGELTPQEWKTLKPHWRRICDEINRIDEDALFAVGMSLLPTIKAD